MDLHPGQYPTGQYAMSPLTVMLLVLSLNPTPRALLRVWAGSPTEQIGCLLGTISGDSLVVEEVRPLVVQEWPSEFGEIRQSTTVARAECPKGTLGRVHNHPKATRCWYQFPGTMVPTGDGVMAARSPFPIDAIVCGSKLVWADRQLNVHEMAL